MRTTINDPRLQDLDHTQAELSLLLMEEEEDEYFERVESLLGTLWTREDVVNMLGGETGDQQVQRLSSLQLKRARYPLALILRPELFKELRERFGLGSDSDDSEGVPGMPHIPKDAKSLAKLDKNEFIRRMGFRPAEAEDGDGIPTSRNIPTGFIPTNPRRLGG